MRKRFVALVLAATWSAGLLVAAATAPWYRSVTATSVQSSSSSAGLPAAPGERSSTQTSTLVEENGTGVLALVALPLAAVAVVAGSLRHRARRGVPGAGPLAWTVVGLLGAFTLAGMMTIGIFVLPVTALLTYACAMTARHAPGLADAAPAPATS